MLSLGLGGLLSIFVPAALAGLNVGWSSTWLWLGPGWALLKPGFDDGVLILWATLISTVLYSIFIWAILYLIVKARRRGTH